MHKNFQSKRKYLDANIPYEYLDLTTGDLKNVFDEKTFKNYMKIHDSILELVKRNYNIIFL